MSGFFDGTRPGKAVEIKGRDFELPVLYFRDDCFGLFFTADLQEVKSIMPSDKLHPVTVPGRKAIVAIVAFNYIDTSIGPYGEIGVVIPAVYGSTPPPALIPLLREGAYPGFGVLVMHLPVTNTLARDGGRGGWGYTKFVADMRFVVTPEFMECRMSEEERHILTLRVARRGITRRDKKPIITFSVKNGNLLKTTIPQRGTFRISPLPAGSFLELGDHPVSDSIRNLGLSARPILSRYYLERSAILPEGEIIENTVRPCDGYIGKDREGQHVVSHV